MKSSLPERRLIPTWRRTVDTLKGAEGASLKSIQPHVVKFNLESFERTLADWNAHPTIGTLGDVLAFSIVPELHERILSIGRSALAKGNPVSPAQLTVLASLSQSPIETSNINLSGALDLGNAKPFQRAITEMRSLLRTAPNSIYTLLDYAQIQVAIGKNRTAERAILTALQLAPDNRIVLRTAARFFAHIRQPDRAHDLIRKHSRTAFDPWLMASEIALAAMAGGGANFINKGRRFIIEKKGLPARHIAELSEAIAMEDLNAGNLKKAREAHRVALLQPNSNVIAQAVDYRLAFGVELATTSVINALAASDEATVLEAWSKQQPEVVENCAVSWHENEPFSSRPLILLSTLDLMQGRYDRSLRWIGAGLLADPEDRGLLINKGFCLARMGRRDEAHSVHRRLRALYGQEIEPYTCATEGLMLYSKGEFVEGDFSYWQAITGFYEQREPQAAAYCLLFQAYVAKDYGHPGFLGIETLARDAAHQHPTPDSNMFLHIQGKAIENIESAKARPLTQLVYNKEKNLLTLVPAVHSSSTPKLIVN